MKASKTQLTNILILSSSSIFFLAIIFILAITQEYNAYGQVDFLGVERALNILSKEPNHLWVFLLSVGAGFFSVAYSVFLKGRNFGLGELFFFMLILDAAALSGLMSTILVQDIFLLSAPALILCVVAATNYMLHLLKSYQLLSL